jgi:hypothetical protein
MKETGMSIVSYYNGGADDQYDESFDWDTEDFLSQEMEFSGPDENEVEAAMEADDTDCTCDYDGLDNGDCGHKADCADCDCGFKPCADCDCVADHAHQEEECDECYCDLEQSEPAVEGLEPVLAALFNSSTGFGPSTATNTSLATVWSIKEDSYLLNQYFNNVDLKVISKEMGLPEDSLRFRLLFLCFRSKGIVLNSTKGANSGKKWAPEEDNALRFYFESGASLQALSLVHQRSSLAIASRLVRLRLAAPIDIEELHKTH